MDLTHAHTLLTAALDEADRTGSDGDDATKRAERVRVIAEQLVSKNITPEVIAGYEMIQAAVTSLWASADRGGARNYIEILVDGVHAPFDRAAIHLIRPGGRTPHAMRMVAEDERDLARSEHIAMREERDTLHRLLAMALVIGERLAGLECDSEAEAQLAEIRRESGL